MSEIILDKFKGCLFGGAIGDAFGYPVEFLKRDEITNKYGEQGLRKLILNKSTGKALISDDTQMTLFTADGLMEPDADKIEEAVYRSYLRWHYTQKSELFGKSLLKEHVDDKSIMDYKEIYNRRAPGMTCLSALSSGKMGTPDEPINNSKGCGGVMRVGPIGLLFYEYNENAFEIAVKAAAITHGHPTGYIAAGAFAVIIAELIKGKRLFESVESCIFLLKKEDKNKETYNAIKSALELASTNEEPYKCIEKLGEGWVAEEALAIAVYCALKAKTFKEAMIMATNHDGDSDSTASICGNLLGARHGMKVIPEYWLEKLELYELIDKMAEDLYKRKRMEDELRLGKFQDYLEKFKKINAGTKRHEIIFLCEKFGSYVRSIDFNETQYYKYQNEYEIISSLLNYKKLLKDCALETYYGLVTYFFREDHHVSGGLGDTYINKALDGRYEFLVTKIIERLKEKIEL